LSYLHSLGLKQTSSTNEIFYLDVLLCMIECSHYFMSQLHLNDDERGEEMKSDNNSSFQSQNNPKLVNLFSKDFSEIHLSNLEVFFL